MNSHQRRVARRARAKEILRAFGLAMDGVSRGFQTTQIFAKSYGPYREG